MRDFRVTPEPGPTVKRSDKKLIFVVQEHHASRLHYDFRLEWGGVLKSWAIPKEPTLDPTVRRLAMPTEDHPLDYASFHGRIPEGEYGAGIVKIWDRGTYDAPEDFDGAYERGRLEFILHGRKLKGSFALIRLKPRPGSRDKESWLFLKMRKEAQLGPRKLLKIRSYSRVSRSKKAA
jgi:bifunctional non-homologous end joining protein LigD